MARMQDKVVLITGGHTGIGRATVEMMRAEGALVTATDVAPGLRSEDRHLDVADEAAWIEVVAEVLDANGRIDVLVNNAGAAGYQALHELERDEWDRVVGVNQLGTYLGLRHVLPAMLDAGRGSVVNVSSIFGVRSTAGIAAYNASKAAVLGITRNAAVTYASQGVRCNAVCPGFIVTPMTDAQDPRLNEEFVARTPIARAGKPVEVAAAITFLASDESSFVTGVELPVDGGYLAV